MIAMNSGVAYFGVDATEPTRYGGRTNPKTIEDLSNIRSFDFEEKSKRERDYAMMDAMGHSLSRKIRIPKNPVIKASDYVVIDDDIYSISYIDHNERDMFVYLEGVNASE